MKKDVYRSKFEAYPFLHDSYDDLRCDFEILTDELSSKIGLLRAIIDDGDLNKELLKICELVYHMNPSLRTFVSLTEQELLWLEERTTELYEKVKDRCELFVLTQGCESACQSHVLRSNFKALVRLLYRYQYSGKEVDKILFDFANLLSQYFFFLALRLNDINNVDEIEYISRNYKNKTSTTIE